MIWRELELWCRQLEVNYITNPMHVYRSRDGSEDDGRGEAFF
jgi:hypothetical protein